MRRTLPRQDAGQKGGDILTREEGRGMRIRHLFAWSVGLVVLVGCPSSTDDDAVDDDDTTASDDDTTASDDDTTSADDDDGIPPDDDDDTADEGPNLLLNPGFEEGEGAYPGVGLHWETNDAQAHADNDFLDDSVAFEGIYSQRIETHGEWDAGMIRQVSGYGTVVEGRTYRLRCAVRTQGMANPAAWYVLGLWWFANDSWLGEVKNEQPADLNYDWTVLVIEETAPPGANRAAAVLSAHYDGTAWYDDVVLAEVVDRDLGTATPP